MSERLPIGVLVATLAAGISVAGPAACATDRDSHGVVPTAAVASANRPEPDHLSAAAAAYQNSGDLSGIEAWLATDPEDPRADYWRELVALRTYEVLALGDPYDANPDAGDDPALEPLPEPSIADLNALVAAYPQTIAGRTAAARLDAEGLRSLRQPPLNERVAHFLEGDDSAVLDVTRDPATFRARHQAGLRDGIRAAIVTAGCDAALGYCTWFTKTFPDDAATPGLERSMKEVWYARAHPPWKSGAHARCSYRCARECRAAAEPLDDTCYAPCWARC